MIKYGYHMREGVLRMEARDIVRKSLQFIEENLEMHLSAGDIAQKMGYSEYYFSRNFKKEMHISVMAYVKKRRLIRASDEILEGCRIIDVALKFGYESHSGFTKAFKNEFGFSPSLLRAVTMGIDCIGGNSMQHVFLERTEPHASKDQLFAVLKNRLSEDKRVWNLGEPERIYQYACHIYRGSKRYSQDEYITHPLNVAILLAQMGAEIHIIYAGMFCDALRETTVTIKEMENNLPGPVADLILKMEKAGSCPVCSWTEDIVLIRLAERLHNMRTMEYMPKEAWKEKAQETLELVMKMADRTGNQKVLDELNDLSLKYIAE